MKRLSILMSICCVLLWGASFAQAPTPPPGQAPTIQTPDENNATLYITQYHLASSDSPVYGLFNIGTKPSVQLVAPSLNGGILKLKLHGKHYLMANRQPFSVMVSFEDESGKVFSQSAKYTFSPDKQNTDPHWFLGLQNIAGLYGSQSVNIPVPPGTSTIDLVGVEGQSTSPNQLVGYVSDIILPQATSTK